MPVVAKKLSKVSVTVQDDMRDVDNTIPTRIQDAAWFEKRESLYISRRFKYCVLARNAR